MQTDTTVGTSGLDLSINPGQVAVLSNGSTFQRVSSAQFGQGDSAAAPNLGTAGSPVYRAPVQLISNHSSGASAKGQLYMSSLQNGFVISERPSIFETTLQIWLRSAAEMGTPPLASPVEIVLTVEDAVSVDSSPFTLRRFNDVVGIDVQAKPQRDSLAVSVRLPGQLSPSRTHLEVQRPELDVSVTPKRIEGFGLGESTVLVKVPGSYPSSVNLSAKTQSATAEPASRSIEPGTSGRFSIRSWGVRKETIRIEGGAFAGDGRTVRLNFVWPVYFILFSLAGSLVGGGIRYYRSPSEKERSKGLMSILTSGVLIGIVGAVLYGIGVSLFPLIPAGETGQAVVFVISATSAVSGPYLPFEESPASA